MSIFRDKIAFVTGAGSGLGKALCEELARRGATSIVTDLEGAAATQVAGEIAAQGGRSCALELDVTRAENVTASIGRTVAQFGRLDYMFNNAGIIILGEVRDMDFEDWNRIIGVNLLGVLHGTAAAYSHMVRQGYGHIVNVSSLGGLVHLPTYAAYSATKHAVVGLSNSLRPEAAKLGVKISVVCPGTMNTGMAAAATIINASRAVLEAGARGEQKMDAVSAARAILRGVERNQGVVVFPFRARLIWWLHRIQPALLAPLDSYFVKTLRQARTEN